MSSMPQISQPVQWFEGMLLSPQHFQQNNNYFEQLMFHQLQRVTPYFFGALELYFDQSAMADQRLLVQKVHAVMTDGTVIDYALNDDEQLPLSNDMDTNLLSYDLTSLKDLKPQTPFFIYLAIAKQNSNSAMAEMKRYDSINTGKVVDQNDSQNQVDLVRLKAKLQLLSESELSPNYSYIPISKLQQNHDGSFQSLNYTPPLLVVHSLISEAPARSTLGHQIENLIASLRSKATEQRNYFVEKQGNDSPINQTQKLKLHHLTQSLPVLEVMLKSQHSHPYDLYLALINLAAAMAILQDDVLPPVYPAYNHQDLDNTFKPVLNDIARIIHSLQLNFEVHALAMNDDGDFRYKYTRPANSEQLMLAFRLTTGVAREQLISWVENAYFCTEDKMEQLLIERITGCKRQQVSEFTVLDLEESDEEIFFTVETNDAYLTDGEKLLIASSDQQLNKFSPAAISWYEQRSKSKR